MPRTITVEGMSCDGCEENVENALRGLPDVSDAKADNGSNSVTIEGDASDDEVAAAVEDAGYTPKV